jgi:hypothetical protein
VFRQASYCPIALKDGGVDRRPGAFHKIDKATFKPQCVFIVATGAPLGQASLERLSEWVLAD